MFQPVDFKPRKSFNIVGIQNLSDNVIKRMKKEVLQTQKDKIEHGFPLCFDDNKNKIEGGDNYGGEGTSIESSYAKCGNGLIKVGSFHTHPVGSSKHRSVADVYGDCNRYISCLGSAKDNEISCITKYPSGDTYEPEDISIECQDKIRPIKNSVQDYKKKLSIVKKNISAIDENIRSTDNESELEGLYEDMDELQAQETYIRKQFKITEAMANDIKTQYFKEETIE